MKLSAPLSLWRIAFVSSNDRLGEFFSKFVTINTPYNPSWLIRLIRSASFNRIFTLESKNLGTDLKINKIVYNGKRNDLYLAIKLWPDALREAFLDFVTYTN